MLRDAPTIDDYESRLRNIKKSLGINDGDNARVSSRHQASRQASNRQLSNSRGGNRSNRVKKHIQQPGDVVEQERRRMEFLTREIDQGREGRQSEI